MINNRNNSIFSFNLIEIKRENCFIDSNRTAPVGLNHMLFSILGSYDRMVQSINKIVTTNVYLLITEYRLSIFKYLRRLFGFNALIYSRSNVVKSELIKEISDTKIVDIDDINSVPDEKKEFINEKALNNSTSELLNKEELIHNVEKTSNSKTILTSISEFIELVAEKIDVPHADLKLIIILFASTTIFILISEMIEKRPNSNPFSLTDDKNLNEFFYNQIKKGEYYKSREGKIKVDELYREISDSIRLDEQIAKDKSIVGKVTLDKINELISEWNKDLVFNTDQKFNEKFVKVKLHSDPVFYKNFHDALLTYQSQNNLNSFTNNSSVLFDQYIDYCVKNGLDFMDEKTVDQIVHTLGPFFINNTFTF